MSFKFTKRYRSNSHYYQATGFGWAPTVDGCEIHFAPPFRNPGMIRFPCKWQRTLRFQPWFHSGAGVRPSTVPWATRGGYSLCSGFPCRVFGKAGFEEGIRLANTNRFEQRRWVECRLIWIRKVLQQGVWKDEPILNSPVR